MPNRQVWNRVRSKPSLDVHLEVYDGPLDLLLHLIEIQELDITDIPISLITDQYLEHLKSIEELNLEIGGEFLVMAATLLSIKARMLLPAPVLDEEAAAIDIDPREELVNLLMEYRKYRQAAQHFDQVLAARGVLANRGSKPQVKVIYQLDVIDPKQLKSAYQQVLEAKKDDMILLPSFDWDVGSKVDQLMKLIEQKGRLLFNQLLDSPNKRGVIVSFLAILEIFRQGLAYGEQQKAFGPITIGYKAGEAL